MLRYFPLIAKNAWRIAQTILTILSIAASLSLLYADGIYAAFYVSERRRASLRLAVRNKCRSCSAAEAYQKKSRASPECAK